MSSVQLRFALQVPESTQTSTQYTLCSAIWDEEECGCPLFLAIIGAHCIREVTNDCPDIAVANVIASDVTITSVKFQGYKALKSFSVSLHKMNVLVGPNNCGKSTVIRAFRVLEVALRSARTKKAAQLQLDGKTVWAHRIPEKSLPISLENVHTDYADSTATIDFRLSNTNLLTLVFPPDGGCLLVPDAHGKQCHTPGHFKTRFPISIQTVPELGPLEYEETILEEATVRQGLSTHRASRHFRNYWRLYSDGFDQFSRMIAQTWPGMEIEPPEVADLLSRRLTMFCREDRMAREIYWAGFGFQVWCQLLTHISRGTEATFLVVDEPEVYLHPDVQRQLVGILREAGPDILVASHSTEIIGESDPSEILVIDKKKKSATRLRDNSQVQAALESIGSLHNVALTKLARTGRLLYVESSDDDKILRRFARKLGLSELASGNDLSIVESEGLGSWKKVEASAWSFKKALQGQFKIGVVFDRDFLSAEQVNEIQSRLSEHFWPVHIHARKEIENYLLNPAPLERAVRKAIRERARRAGEKQDYDLDMTRLLDEITDATRDEVTSQLIAKRIDYLKPSGKNSSTITNEVLETVRSKWTDLESRIELVPGKIVLARLRQKIRELHSVNISDIRIIDEFRSDEIPTELAKLLLDLNVFRGGGG